MFEEENAEHPQISLSLHFSTSTIFQLPFFFLLKLCKVLAHLYFYQIGISFCLIPSESQEQSHPNSRRLQKLCTFLRVEYSSLRLSSLPKDYYTRKSLSFWTLVLLVSGMIVVICHFFWTPTQPTSISVTHLLKHVNNPGTEAAKWKAAFTTCSRRCNKAVILPFGLAKAVGRTPSYLLGNTNDIWVLGGCHCCQG